MEMTRSLLKHMTIPNYLWGEAVRHATYLINRASTRVLTDTTPYEVYNKKKPNVEHLRVFGCMGYAKADTAHLKKLDDRSRLLIHLGTEPGSKAYRLYDPTHRRIVISKDVVFDERKSWKWNVSDSSRQSVPSMFIITMEEYGNQGIKNAEVTEESNEPETIGENEMPSSLLGEVVTDEEEEDQTSAQPAVRKSLRVSKRPNYLSDYVCLAEAEGERLLLMINEEPCDFDEVIEQKVW